RLSRRNTILTIAGYIYRFGLFELRLHSNRGIAHVTSVPSVAYKISNSARYRCGSRFRNDGPRSIWLSAGRPTERRRLARAAAGGGFAGASDRPGGRAGGVQESDQGR